MHFIDKQQGAPTGLLAVCGAGKNLAQVGNTVKDGRDRFKNHTRRISQQTRNGGLAGTGRPPEYDRRQFTRIQHPAQAAIRADQLVLANHILQPLRAQKLGEGRTFRRAVHGFEVKLAHGVIFARRCGTRQRNSGALCRRT
ncbi:MAG: Uncharacterised protein [SAR116 cluster bacterium]|nr:MAG: Uncharacterised protein [SAR116 cluster bacterium]